MFRHELTNLRFEEELYRIVTRVNTSSEIGTLATIEAHQNIWATREDHLGAFRTAFNTTTELYYDPLNKSLSPHTYHFLYSENMVFSTSGSNAAFAWQGTIIKNPMSATTLAFDELWNMLSPTLKDWNHTLHRPH
jgi:hypothetical protein